MPHDPRVDAYIEQAAPFARPILTHLRATVHAACPDAAETIKWGRPFFTIAGKPMAMMAAFKAHAGFGFWQSGAMERTGREAEAAGQFGKLATLADLPDDVMLADQLRKAADVIRGGAPAASRPPRIPRPPLETPLDLADALADDGVAASAFAALRPSHRREYVEWIIAAKRPETRAKRITQAIEKLKASQSLNAAYAKC